MIVGSWQTTRTTGPGFQVVPKWEERKDWNQAHIRASNLRMSERQGTIGLLVLVLSDVFSSARMKTTHKYLESQIGLYPAKNDEPSAGIEPATIRYTRAAVKVGGSTELS